jgi:O-acetyl-ADP-ribose deacetylase (regulator of RNase III)
MVHFVTGDFWQRDADIRVNTVNCVGVMGKGVALQFKKRYPEMFEQYRADCRNGLVVPGEIRIYRTPDTVVNFPTKRHWRDNSRLEDIESGLLALRRYLRPHYGEVVTVPALGCGHGGLDWNTVRPLIEDALGGLDAEIYVYSPEDSRRMP